MYQLLIEAVGRSQARRIHPEYAARLDSTLQHAVAQYGFAVKRSDADQLLFACDPGAAPQARDLVLALDGAATALGEFGDLLLDYTVLLAEREERDLCSEDLAAARHERSAYLSGELLPLVGTLCSYESHGPVARVLQFQIADDVGGARAEDVLVDDQLLRRLDHASRNGGDRQWLWARDVSVIDATLLSLARQRRLPVLRLGPTDSEAEVYRRLLVALRDTTATIEGDFAGPVRAVAACAHAPASLAISSGWRSGEFRLAAAHVLAAAQPGCLVALDFDLWAAAARDAFTRLVLQLPNAPAILVAAACAPTDTEWTEQAIEIDTQRAGERLRTGGDTAFASRYGSLERYWSQVFAATEHGAAQRWPAMEPATRGALTALAATEAIFGVTEPEALLASLGLSSAGVGRLLNELARSALVDFDATRRVHPAAARRIPGLLTPEEHRALYDTIRRHVTQSLATAEIRLTQPVWRLLSDNVDHDESARIWHRYMHTLAVGADGYGFRRALGLRRESSRFELASQAAARIKLHVRGSRGPVTVESDAETVREMEQHVPGYARADLLLSLGEYELARRRYGEAIDFAKHTVMLEQEGELRDSSAAGYLLMARIMLARRNVADAARYLAFAQEGAGNDRATELVARCLDGVRSFLIGDLTRADARLADLRDPLYANGFTEWLLLVWFLRARIRVELGDYVGAAEEFCLVERFSTEIEAPQPGKVAARWAQRCNGLGGGAAQTVVRNVAEDTPTAEGEYIMGEALADVGSYQEALDHLERAARLESAQERWPRMGVCWDNGFAPVEDLVMATAVGESQLQRLIDAHRAWCMAQLDRSDDAQPIFDALTRSSVARTDDPYTSHYTYLYASTLPEQRSRDRDDLVTVLGKAVKLSQERMSRIDAYEDKMRFLRCNLWSRRLMEAARRHNLV